MRTPETISRLLEAAHARGWQVRRRSIGGWPWPASVSLFGGSLRTAVLMLDGRLSPACRLAALRLLADRLPAALDGNSAFVAVLPKEVDHAQDAAWQGR